MVSKTSQLSVSYINTAFQCCLNCFPITAFKWHILGKWIFNRHNIVSKSFLCMSSMVLSHAHCNWRIQSWFKQPSCFFSDTWAVEVAELKALKCMLDASCGIANQNKQVYNILDGDIICMYVYGMYFPYKGRYLQKWICKFRWSSQHNSHIHVLVLTATATSASQTEICHRWWHITRNTLKMTSLWSNSLDCLGCAQFGLLH